MRENNNKEESENYQLACKTNTRDYSVGVNVEMWPLSLHLATGDTTL